MKRKFRPQSYETTVHKWKLWNESYEPKVLSWKFWNDAHSGAQLARNCLYSGDAVYLYQEAETCLNGFLTFWNHVAMYWPVLELILQYIGSSFRKKKGHRNYGCACLRAWSAHDHGRQMWARAVSGRVGFPSTGRNCRAFMQEIIIGYYKKLYRKL